MMTCCRLIIKMTIMIMMVMVLMSMMIMVMLMVTTLNDKSTKEYVSFPCMGPVEVETRSYSKGIPPQPLDRDSHWSSQTGHTGHRCMRQCSFRKKLSEKMPKVLNTRIRNKVLFLEEIDP